MKNILITVFAAVMFSACSSSPAKLQDVDSSKLQDTGTSKAIDSNRIILPGIQLGHLMLGITDSMLIVQLGKPDFTDAAMGKAMLVWYGKKNEAGHAAELNVFVTYKDSNMREKTVRQIRSTSSYFVLNGSLRVSANFREFQSAYPQLTYIDKYKDNITGLDTKIYDDTLNGLAVETTSGASGEVCTSIIVHRPHDIVSLAYVNLR